MLQGIWQGTSGLTSWVCRVPAKTTVCCAHGSQLREVPFPRLGCAEGLTSFMLHSLSVAQASFFPPSQDRFPTSVGAGRLLPETHRSVRFTGRRSRVTCLYFFMLCLLILALPESQMSALLLSLSSPKEQGGLLPRHNDPKQPLLPHTSPPSTSDDV